MSGLMRKHLATSIKRWQKSRLRHGKGTTTPARPRLEVLEDRVVPSGVNWSGYNYDSAGTRNNTAEHTLSPSNVGNLQV